MPDEENDLLEASLTGYKEKMVPAAKTTLRWDRDLIFVGGTEAGYEVSFDAHAQWGCHPMEALLLSLAGCMAIDVVMILRKMRVQLASLRMDLQGERNPSPPQYFKTIEMVLSIAGKNLDSRKVDRAVALSHAKYCSVYNTLRKDLELKVRCVLEDEAPP